jgi:Ca-activated chloride channel family protein
VIRLIVVGLLAISPPLAGILQAQPAPAVIFRTSVDLVPVVATVRDETGQLVTGLHKKDFWVEDDGVWRPIKGFSEDDSAPVSLALLVDESGSMRENGALTRATVNALLAALGVSGTVGDRVALLGFDSSVHELQGFTADTGAVRRALDDVDPFGATAAHDAIAETARRLGPLGGRRALVVISDGLDTRSQLTLQQASAVASAIDVPVYVVLTRWTASAGPALSAATLGPLQQLARWTGGEGFAASGPLAIDMAAQRIVSEVRHQYLIAFEPAERPGWRALTIHTLRSGLTVRARSAYVAGRAGSAAAR